MEPRELLYDTLAPVAIVEGGVGRNSFGKLKEVAAWAAVSLCIFKIVCLFVCLFVCLDY
jgi:hypothetical protein